jgi:hypothetical protein
MSPSLMTRSKSMLKVGVLLAVGTSASIAQAQLEPRITGQPGEEHIRSVFGVSVQGGGGVMNFTGGSERGVTDLGGSWEARAVFGTRMIPALEAAYIGSARNVSGGVASGTGLVGNGLEGAFRLNAPFLTNRVLVEPFIFGGLGWSHYSLNHLSNNVIVSRSDDIGTIPMGGGLAVGYQGFLAEARFTYRPAFDDNGLVLATDGRTMSMDTWNISLSIGYEF